MAKKSKREAASPSASIGDIPLRGPDLPVHQPEPSTLGPGEREGYYGEVPFTPYPGANQSLPHNPYSDEEEETGGRLARKLGFKSISGRY